MILTSQSWQNQQRELSSTGKTSQGDALFLELMVFVLLTNQTVNWVFVVVFM